MNRTLVEMVRSMMASAKLPKKLWAEALSTAAYVRNRSPTKAVAGKTSYEAWTGEKPKVDHLRAFGCASYAHIPKDERRKLDVKAKKCIFLGYGTDTRGYWLYNPERQRVFHSRDVLYNELENGIEKESQDEQPFVILDESEHRIEEESTPVGIPCQDDENRSVQEPSSAGQNDERSSDSDEDASDEEPSQQEVRRSQSERRPCNFYGNWATIGNADLKEPTTVKEALSTTDQEKWQIAMDEEVKSLGSKWAFKRKLDADGTVERYKARLVAQGFSQQSGLDYDQTFSPVVRFESLRIVTALAVQHGLKLHQLDVTTAFLNGALHEEVYMKQPEGYAVKGQEHLVCKLKQSIYGLKQLP